MSARLASTPPCNELGHVAESTRAIAVRIHDCFNCVLGFLAPILGELRRCHAGKSVPGGPKAWEIETERFGLHPSFNSSCRELCEERSRICQGSGAHAGAARAGEDAGRTTVFAVHQLRCNLRSVSVLSWRRKVATVGGAALQKNTPSASRQTRPSIWVMSEVCLKRRWRYFLPGSTRLTVRLSHTIMRHDA